MEDDCDKCPKCTLNPDSMIASCTSEGCPIWKNPIPTKDQESLFQAYETKLAQRDFSQNKTVLSTDLLLKKRLPSVIDTNHYNQPYAIPMTPQTPTPQPKRGETTSIYHIDESPFVVVPDPVEMINVDKQALRQILEALNGPMHLIRELQVTRVNPNLPPLVMEESGKPYTNPIDTLIRNYNDSVKS